MKTTLIIILTLLVNCLVLGQGIAIRPDQSSLEKYKGLTDTVIVETGNSSLFGEFHVKSDKERLCCFARREITVKNGEIKKIHLYDTNAGCKTDWIQKNGRLVLKSRECKGTWATNAPHFY